MNTFGWVVWSPEVLPVGEIFVAKTIADQEGNVHRDVPLFVIAEETREGFWRRNTSAQMARDTGLTLAQESINREYGSIE